MVFLAPHVYRASLAGGDFDAVLAQGKSMRAREKALDVAATRCRDAPDALLPEVLAKVEAERQAAIP